MRGRLMRPARAMRSRTAPGRGPAPASPGPTVGDRVRAAAKDTGAAATDAAERAARKRRALGERMLRSLSAPPPQQIRTRRK